MFSAFTLWRRTEAWRHRRTSCISSMACRRYRWPASSPDWRPLWRPSSASCCRLSGSGRTPAAAARRCAAAAAAARRSASTGRRSSSRNRKIPSTATPRASERHPRDCVHAKFYRRCVIDDAFFLFVAMATVFGITECIYIYIYIYIYMYMPIWDDMLSDAFADSRTL